jgi:tetratricopeptide (TPR) repeat protein
MNDRIDALSEGPQSSPFYNYCLSMVYMQKAIIDAKFNEKVSAAFNIRRSYQYIKANEKSFSTFSPNTMLYGSLQAIMSIIPKGYQWMTNLLGLRGSMSNGMRILKDFVYSNDPYARLMNSESSFLYGFLLFNIENKKEEALQFIKDRKLDVVNNHLLAYMAANLNKNGQHTEAAKNIILNRNQSPEYLQTEVWNYELGYCQLHQLDLKAAITSFEHFVNNFKGNFYIKDVYQKISWCYYLLGNMQAAQAARNHVLDRGNTVTDADMQALKEAKSGKWPNPFLLKARILNDGGYNNESLALLTTKTIDSFSTIEDKLDFVYRLGRVYDDLNKPYEAIVNYLKAIELGENRTDYFAARAAWQIGLIYEKQGNKQQAINYYNKCLSMENHDYKNSLDEKAKSGIARCKGD